MTNLVVKLWFFMSLLLISTCETKRPVTSKKGKEVTQQTSHPLKMPKLSPALLSASHTFMPNNASQYIDKIDKYYEQRGKEDAGTYLLMQRYKELFNSMYDAHIKNSILGLYFYKEKIEKDDYLNFSLNPGFLTSSRINYIPSDKPYTYKPFEAYVDFANRLIGGGVMRGGLVQEEVMLLESSVLPFIAESRTKDNAAPFSFALDIPLNSLDVSPVVLKFRMINQLKIYGNARSIIDEASAAKNLVSRANVVDIYVPAMAAPHFSGGETQYSMALLEQMYNVAFRAFFTTLLAQHAENHALVIHSGNWGAGVFGNSLYMSWAIQRLAAETAYILFCEALSIQPKFTYVHDAYNAKSFAAVQEALGELTAQIENSVKASGKEEISPAIVLSYLLELSKQNEKWRPGYKVK